MPKQTMRLRFDILMHGLIPLMLAILTRIAENDLESTTNCVG